MSWTKDEIITAAMTELGIADYEFDISVGEKQTALRRLDMMMAEWGTRGLRLSYPLSSSSTLDEESNIPDLALEAVVTNLAIRLAPSYGKVLPLDTKVIARKTLTTLYGKYNNPPQVQFPQMPKGAGYKGTDNTYTSVPEDALAVGKDSELDLEGAF